MKTSTALRSTVVSCPACDTRLSYGPWPSSCRCGRLSVNTGIITPNDMEGSTA